MKKIYIVFIASNFKSGKLIRFFTRGRYNHIAFSHEPYISEVYSFARYNYYESLLGGFGPEYSNRYLCQGKDIAIKICQYDVAEGHYERIKEKLDYYGKTKTRYNILSVLTYPLKKQVELPDTHTCISFMLELLELNNNITINKLETMLSKSVIYEGNLSNRLSYVAALDEDEFFVRKKRLDVWRKNCLYYYWLFATLVRIHI